MGRNGFAAMAAAVLIAGCATSQWLSRAPVPPQLTVDSPTFRLVEPWPKDVHVKVLAIRRGVRGGSLLLELSNGHPEDHLVYDWSGVSIRLGSGRRRRCMADSEYLTMAMEFGFASYGGEYFTKAKSDPWMPCQYPKKGRRHFIWPGESVAVVIHFRAPSEENQMLLALDKALSWQKVDGTLLGEVTPPPRVVVDLPVVEVETRPEWWPDWLHVGFELSSG